MSREEAINVITNADLSKVEDRVIKAIFYLCTNKALEQEPRWIPVSERLPEEFAEVFCSTNAGEVFIAAYLGKMNDGVDCFDDDNGMMWNGDVIAWMPLPEPYKESEGK